MEKILIGNRDEFAEIFIDKYLENGLGTMSKREIDILVVNLLMQHGHKEEISDDTKLEDIGNNGLSILLQATEASVRNLRYQALLRYPPEQDYIKTAFRNLLVKSQFEYDGSGADIYQGKICFVMEDKYLRQAIQGILKDAGQFADTTFNREIIRISPDFFIEVIANLYGQETADEYQVGFDLLAEGSEGMKEAELEGIFNTFIYSMAEAAGTAAGTATIALLRGQLGL